MRIGGTFPYVASADALAPRAHEVTRRLAPEVMRVCSFTEERDWERMRELGVEEFILRPKWHHGRGRYLENENILDIQEWPDEPTLRDRIRWLGANGFFFMLEGPNEPCIECFADEQTESGLWLAEDPEIYLPEAYRFTEWWGHQMDYILDAFPGIVFLSPPVSAGNEQRARDWMEIMGPIVVRSKFVNVHWYWWHEGDDWGGLYHPAWGGQLDMVRSLYPDQEVVISEANCNAMLAHIDQLSHYPRMCEIARDAGVRDMCFFEVPGSPGQEQHGLSNEIADAIFYWKFNQLTKTFDEQEANDIYDQQMQDLRGRFYEYTSDITKSLREG